MRIDTNAERAPGFDIAGLENERRDRTHPLAQVVDRVNELIGPRAAAALGPLVASRARAIHTTEVWHIVSSPIEALGGGFCFSVPDGHIPERDVEMVARACVKAARLFVANWRHAAAEIEWAGTEARKALDRHGGPSAPARLEAVFVEPFPKPGAPPFFGYAVDLVVLDDDLASVRLRFADKEPIAVWVEVGQILRRHVIRTELLSRLRPHGVDALVSETAHRVMAAAGMELAFAIDRLGSCSRMTFRFGRDGRVGSLFWSDGVLQTSFEQPLRYEWNNGARRRIRDAEVEGVALHANRLMLETVLPATLRAGLVGERLGRLVEHPFLPPESLITAVDDLADISPPWPSTNPLPYVRDTPVLSLLIPRLSLVRGPDGPRLATGRESLAG